MRIAGWEFSPGRWPSVGMVLVFPLLLSLGYWQMDRAAQKRTLDENFKARQNVEVTNLNRATKLRNDVDALLWRKVTVDGSFSSQTNILLDNQVLGGEVGYFVYTPFKLKDENLWALVNRGWVPAGEYRDHAPQVMTNEKILRIKGVVKVPPATGILLAENSMERLDDVTVRTQKLDLALVEEFSNLELLPYIVRLDASEPEGFVRYWQAPGSGEAKHLGYAFQWFAMAAAIMLIYLILNIKRVK